MTENPALNYSENYRWAGLHRFTVWVVTVKATVCLSDLEESGYHLRYLGISKGMATPKGKG